MSVPGIDRKALLTKHNPSYALPLPKAPLSVGNGDFCFTADFTGLQTFPSAYNYFPLCIMAGWGWHSYPDAIMDPNLFRLTSFDTHGRKVGYASDGSGQEDLYNSLRQNPHRFNLGRLGLDIPESGIEDCTDVKQNLNLWEGFLDSVFCYRGETIRVNTFVRSDDDALCVKIVSGLIRDGKLGVRLNFPYASHNRDGSDYSRPGSHQSILEEKISSLNIYRRLDNTGYTVQVLMGEGVFFKHDGEHVFSFSSRRDCIMLALRFVPENGLLLSGFSAENFYEEGKKQTVSFWENYWNSGGAIDLGGSSAPEAPELERRIVLSQYLTAIQSRGNLPPSETGLSCNSWYGKFHLEMYYWHCAHFPLWNRSKELRKSFAWYKTILNEACRIAASQGYSGARWPKMCCPLGRDSPSPIGPLLVWQQPHPILLAELCYRQEPDRTFLEEYREILSLTAEFMLSFIYREGSRYVLGPPLIPAQECFDPNTVLNPGYETEYFRWAFRQANIWLKRLNEKERPEFEEAAQLLAAPAVYGGVFPAHENCPDTFSQSPFNTDHPSMLGMIGLLPGKGINKSIMNNTLDKVLSDWDLDSCWGWDFPMMAMTAARLGRKKDAVRLLLMESPKNTYLPNGHNAQGDREDLPLYLPGNGGLLLAAAMMAAGWDNDGNIPAPGFPDDGTYRVKFENLHKYI